MTSMHTCTCQYTYNTTMVTTIRTIAKAMTKDLYLFFYMFHCLSLSLSASLSSYKSHTHTHTPFQIFIRLTFLIWHNEISLFLFYQKPYRYIFLKKSINNTKWLVTRSAGRKDRNTQDLLVLQQSSGAF